MRSPPRYWPPLTIPELLQSVSYPSRVGLDELVSMAARWFSVDDQIAPRVVRVTLNAVELQLLRDYGNKRSCWSDLLYEIPLGSFKAAVYQPGIVDNALIGGMTGRDKANGFVFAMMAKADYALREHPVYIESLGGFVSSGKRMVYVPVAYMDGRKEFVPKVVDAE